MFLKEAWNLDSKTLFISHDLSSGPKEEDILMKIHTLGNQFVLILIS